jgi:hypothetical protein
MYSNWFFYPALALILYFLICLPIVDGWFYQDRGRHPLPSLKDPSGWPAASSLGVLGDAP